MTRNILFLTYWSYEEGLIQSYTLPYVRMILKLLPKGSECYLVTLEKNDNYLSGALHNQASTALRAEGIHWMPYQYRPFGLRAILSWLLVCVRLGGVIVTKNVETVHCWCTPAGGVGYFLATFLRRRLVVDSYEPHAESMVENGTWKSTDLAFRILFWLEKLQTRRANVLIAAAQGMHEYAMEKYGVNVPQTYVKPACVNLEVFTNVIRKDPSLLGPWHWEDKIICVYAGKLGGIYQDQEVFDFLKVAASHWGDKFRFLFLTNQSEAEVRGFCSKSNFDFGLIKMLHVPHAQIHRYLALGDFALTPVKPVPTKRYCTPIKDGEYWAVGLPVIIPHDISDDSAIIEQEHVGHVLRSFTQVAYQEAIERIEELLRVPAQDLTARIQSIARKYRTFEVAERIYRQIYSS